MSSHTASSIIIFSRIWYNFSRKFYWEKTSLNFTVDSAEGGKRDFPKNVTMVTIPAGVGIRRDFPVSIAINLDNINEAAEGFLILVETSQETSVMAEAPIINYARDGLAIGLIADDDG